MSRQVITEKDVQGAMRRRAAAGEVARGAADGPAPDEYADRLIKYIPSEVVGVFLSVNALLTTAGDQVPKDILAWVIFGFLLVMTPIYLRRVQNVEKLQQLLISTISFAVWIFTLGGPFAQFSWYSPFYGAVLLPLYTLAVATYKAQ